MFVGMQNTLKAFANQFDNHALLMLVIAGCVRNYRPAPGDFDVWYADDARNLRLSELNLKQRRTHILQYALDGLGPEQSKLLGQVEHSDIPLTITLYALSIRITASHHRLRLRANSLQAAELDGRGLLRWYRRTTATTCTPLSVLLRLKTCLATNAELH